jgi:hypothetical protein
VRLHVDGNCNLFGVLFFPDLCMRPPKQVSVYLERFEDVSGVLDSDVGVD